MLLWQLSQKLFDGGASVLFFVELHNPGHRFIPLTFIEYIFKDNMSRKNQIGRLVVPIRWMSIARAALRPSESAQTTSDWPRRASPAAKTPGTLVI